VSGSNIEEHLGIVLRKMIGRMFAMHCLDYSGALSSIHPLVEARRSALSGFPLNKTPDGPLVGAYGELVAERFLEDLIKHKKILSFRYTGGALGPDFEIVKLTGETFSVDVKTKRRTKDPRDYFEMSVPAYLESTPGYSDPDVFLCVQVQTAAATDPDFVKAWIVGYITKENYWAKRKPVPEGEIVGGPSGITGEMPCDVWNVEFSDLAEPKPLSSLITNSPPPPPVRSPSSPQPSPE